MQETTMYFHLFESTMLLKGINVLVNFVICIFFSQVGDEKDMYTDADLDEVREDWASFVSNWILNQH